MKISLHSSEQNIYISNKVFCSNEPIVPIAYYYYFIVIPYLVMVICTTRTGDFNTTLPDEQALEIRRAYNPTVSYIDGLVGQMMDVPDMHGLADNTVVVFTSDH